MNKQDGFTLIELLIVVVIIGILAAIAIPGYIGMQERARKGAIIRTATASEAELQAWLHSAVKGLGGTQASIVEVDSDGNGQISGDGLPANGDVNNSQLGNWLTGGNLTSAYVSAKRSLTKEMSPWDPTKSLWSALPTGNMGACIDDTTTIAANQTAATSRILAGGTSAAPYRIDLFAEDAKKGLLHKKSIYTD